MDIIEQLLAIANPVIVGIIPTVMPWIFRGIYLLHPNDLHNIVKMLLTAITGAIMGVGMFVYGVGFESLSEAVRIGFLSGAIATGAYGALRRKTSESTIVVEPPVQYNG